MTEVKAARAIRFFPKAWINEIMDSTEETVKLGSSENLRLLMPKGKLSQQVVDDREIPIKSSMLWEFMDNTSISILFEIW